MFQHPTRSTNANFTQLETLRYLSWLARTMIRHNLITYQIEAMQPLWLENRSDDWLYRLIVRLLFGLIIALVASVLNVGLIYRLFGGQLNLLVATVFVVLLSSVASVMAIDISHIQMVDRLKWSWAHVRTWTLLIVNVGLVCGIIGVLYTGQRVGGLVGLGVGLLVGLLFALQVMLIPYQIEQTSYPGQRYKQTVDNGLRFALPGGLVIGLGAGLFTGLHGGLGVGLLTGLGTAVAVGLLAGLGFGYGALLQHYLLRWLLARRNLLPRQLIPFLEHAVGLIFLRRVGGSYVFIHRLLMEHFAEMDV